jgi:hypothetical protein
MGKSLEQLFASGSEGRTVDVSIVTNQDNLVVSYASGTLNYHPPVDSGIGVPIGSRPFHISARLSTTGGKPLDIFFSDRRLDIDPHEPTPAGSFGNAGLPRQPFSANNTDKIGVSISQNLFSPPVAKFTLLSWDNATYTVALESRGNLLVGVGPGAAVYVISFSDWLPIIG